MKLCVLCGYGVGFSAMHRPIGVTIIALLFFVAAIYLWTIGAVKLVAPEAISLMAGSQLMYSLELAGPYMALLVGTGYAGWLGIISSAQLGALVGDAGDGDCRRVARPEDLDGRDRYSAALVRIPDCPSRCGWLVSRASPRSG